MFRAISCLLFVLSAVETQPLSIPDEIAAAQRRLKSDWAGLNVFGSENSEMPPPQAGENRVIFFGDQITALWGHSGKSQFFPGSAYLNRGVYGQTSPQMLIRFRQDVIDLKAKVVVISAGSNDIASVTGPSPVPLIQDNLMSMVDLAKANGIKVVLASVTPVCDCFSQQTPIRPAFKIGALNRWMKEYAGAQGLVYLDYFSALIDDDRRLRREYTVDGVLLNDAAYGVMTDLALKAIAAALK